MYTRHSSVHFYVLQVSIPYCQPQLSDTITLNGKLSWYEI